MNCERSGSEGGRSFGALAFSFLVVGSVSGDLGGVSETRGRPANARGAESL